MFWFPQLSEGSWVNNLTKISWRKWGTRFSFPFKNIQGVPKNVCLATGCPKKIRFKPIFDFLNLGGVFLGVKNNSRNFGNKKNIGLLSKILSKLTLFIRKMRKFGCFYELIAMARIEKIFKCHKSQCLCICT